MRIFLTGATSLIGAAVAPALVKAGHHVTAILRPTGPVPARLREQGIDVLTGDLSDIAANRSALEGYEALVHCARDTSPRGAGIDRQVIDACRDVFWRAGRGLFVYASSAWVIGPTRGAVDESTAINPPEVERDRPATEQAVLESQGGGVRAVVVRPGLVYGGDSGVDLGHAARRLQRHRPRRRQRRQSLAADLSRRSRRSVRPAGHPRRRRRCRPRHRRQRRHRQRSRRGDEQPRDAQARSAAHVDRRRAAPDGRAGRGAGDGSNRPQPEGARHRLGARA